MQTVKQACAPRPGVFDPSRRDTVLHLGDLVADRIDSAEFCAENYSTEGMCTLLTEGFRRLEGHSTQGACECGQISSFLLLYVLTAIVFLSHATR